jgi:hypothetical protein
MLETTEALSSDLRASAPVYLEDVNDRGIVMLVTRHTIKASSPATSTPGASLAGYALPRTTSGRSRKPGATNVLRMSRPPWHRAGVGRELFCAHP